MLSRNLVGALIFSLVGMNPSSFASNNGHTPLPSQNSMETNQPNPSDSSKPQFDEKTNTFIHSRKLDGTKVDFETRIHPNVDLSKEESRSRALNWAKIQTGSKFQGALKKLFEMYTNEKVYRINLAVTATLLGATAYTISFIAIPSSFEVAKHWPVIAVSAGASGVLRYFYQQTGEFIERGQTFFREHVRWAGIELGYFILSTAVALGVGLKSFDSAELAKAILIGSAGGLWAQGAFDAGIARMATRQHRVAQTQFDRYKVELKRHMKGMLVSSIATGINLAYSLSSDPNKPVYEEPLFYAIAIMGGLGNLYYWKRARSKKPLPCESSF